MANDAIPDRSADREPAVTQTSIGDGDAAVRVVRSDGYERLARAWADCDLADEMLDS